MNDSVRVKVRRVLVPQVESVAVWRHNDGVKVEARFVRDGNWWVAWTPDVPGALTQGRTLDAARENLVDAVREMLKPVDTRRLPKGKVVVEDLEV